MVSVYCFNKIDEVINYLFVICIHLGTDCVDRTKVGTKKLVGAMLKFDMSDGVLPALTVKNVSLSNVLRELLWLISGSTNSNTLNDTGCKIWNANGAATNGDLGPIYGHQWRHFGAEYKDCHTDYSGCGVDQLENAIELIKNDPQSRRIIVCAWNPAQLKQMALPPCHILFQLNVDKDNRLNLVLFQRSADVGLGVPYNITSYGLVLTMLCHVTGLKPGELTMMFGDVHIYTNHFEGMQTILGRTPKKFPTVKINGHHTNINDIKFEDFTFEGYESYPAVPLAMAL